MRGNHEAVEQLDSDLRTRLHTAARRLHQHQQQQQGSEMTQSDTAQWNTARHHQIHADTASPVNQKHVALMPSTTRTRSQSHLLFDHSQHKLGWVGPLWTSLWVAGNGVASYEALKNMPLDFQQCNFFSSFETCTKSDGHFVRLPLQRYLYSLTVAVVVQLRLHELNLVRCIILCQMIFM